MSKGIRILSHIRGNPDTDVGRSLPDTESPLQPVSSAEQKRGALKTWRESDHLIVLGGRESRSQGEAAIRSLEMTPSVRDEGLRSKRSLITWVS